MWQGPCCLLPAKVPCVYLEGTLGTLGLYRRCPCALGQKAKVPKVPIV